MIRNILTAFVIVLGFAGISFADVMPLAMSEIPAKSIGVYQVSSSKLTVYDKPTNNAKVVYEETIDYSHYLDKTTSPVFCVILPKKQLSYLYATDCYDEWVEVIYNKAKNLIGWVKKDDFFQFLPWVNFYGMYGRKYGLVELKTGQKFNGTLHSQPDENSQIVANVVKPVRIRLTSIEGNWALVSILDITGSVHTGYLQWRTQDGKYFVFPEFK